MALSVLILVEGPYKQRILVVYKYEDIRFCGQNVASEWLAFLHCVRNVPVSNIDQQTGYPDKTFVVFSIRTCK